MFPRFMTCQSNCLNGTETSPEDLKDESMCLVCFCVRSAASANTANDATTMFGSNQQRIFKAAVERGRRDVFLISALHFYVTLQFIYSQTTNLSFSSVLFHTLLTSLSFPLLCGLLACELRVEAACYSWPTQYKSMWY